MAKLKRILAIFLINFAVTVSLILVIGMVAEWYLKSSIPSADYRGLYELTSDPRIYAMKPGFDQVRHGVRIKTNSHGFRDGEFDELERQNKFIIAVLGDSFTFGQGVPQEQTYPALLQDQLNRLTETNLFRVWNLGVSGYNTEQEAHVFQSFVLSKTPEWVVVGYNLNDYEPVASSEMVSTSEPIHLEKTSWLTELFSGQLFVIHVLKYRIGGLIRLFKPEWYASSYIEDIRNEYLGPGEGWRRVSHLLSIMNDECRENKIGFTVAVLPPMLSFQHYPLEAVHKAIVSSCRSNGVDCVDILPRFQATQLEGSTTVSSVDAHPNARAQKIYAETIAQHLLANAAFSHILAEKKGKRLNAELGAAKAHNDHE